MISNRFPLKILFLIPLLFFSHNGIRAQSLTEVIKIAQKANPNILAGRQANQRAAYNALAAFRSTLPAVDLSASYNHITDVGQIEFPSMPGIPSRKINLGVHDNYESSLTANYVVFSGFAQSAGIAIKNNLKNISRVELDKTEKNIVFQTIASYRQVQLNRLEINVLKSARQRAGLQMGQMRSLAKHGMVLASDTLSLAIAALNYDQKIIAVQSAMETARDQLLNLTGASIKVEELDEGLMIFSIARLRTETNEDLQKLSIREKISRYGKTADRSAYFPAVSVLAGIKYGKPGADFVQNEWMTYGVWGIGLQWNLFSWGRDKLSIQAREAEIREIAFQKQALKQNIETKYNSAHRSFQTLEKQLAVFQASLELAEKKMKIVAAQYEQGMTTVTVFNEANLELAEAGINVKRQRILMSLKINEIEYISGKPIIEWSIN